MVCPSLISVSVTPGPYLLSAAATGERPTIERPSAARIRGRIMEATSSWRLRQGAFCYPGLLDDAVQSPLRPETPPKFSESWFHEASLLKSSQHSIVVGDRTVDLARETLRDERGDIVPLRPRAWAVLRLLATRAGQLVGKDEIMDEVWSDCEVTEDSLVQAIGDIRRALGDASRPALKTLPRRGYMLVTNGEPTDGTVVSGDAPRSSDTSELPVPSPM